MTGHDGINLACNSTVMVTRFMAKRLRPVFIKEWLDYCGVSQTKLADLMGTDKSNITRWIKEPNRVNLDAISGICTALAPFAPELEDAGNLFRHPSGVRSVEAARDAAHRLIEALPLPPQTPQKPLHPKKRKIRTG